jgi:hypothetical protein
MPVTLLSPRLKLERAQEHIEAFHGELSAYMKRHPHRLSTKRQNDGWEVVSIEIVRPMPERIPLIAGDAVHCLRSALDHIVYAIGKGAKKRSGYWPICIAEDDYLLPRGKPPCERPGMRDEGLAAVPEGLRTIIDEAQPYHGGDRAEEHVFAVLNRLDNADKHRIVQTALAVVRHPGDIKRTHPTKDDGKTLTTEWLGIDQPLRMNKKTELLRWKTDPPSNEVYVTYTPSLGVVLGERASWEHITRAQSNIYKLVELIESAVLN